MSSKRRLRKKVMRFCNPESVAYRKAFWGKHCKIFVSLQDWKDIRAAKMIMRKTVMGTITMTTDQTKVPWYTDKEPQHKPWYTGKKDSDNEYICQLTNQPTNQPTDRQCN